VLTYKMAIVLRPQICDVISPYVYTSPPGKMPTESATVDYRRVSSSLRICNYLRQGRLCSRRCVSVCLSDC